MFICIIYESMTSKNILFNTIFSKYIMERMHRLSQRDLFDNNIACAHIIEAMKDNT